LIFKTKCWITFSKLPIAFSICGIQNQNACMRALEVLGDERMDW
jgi:hypothetical protein